MVDRLYQETMEGYYSTRTTMLRIIGTKLPVPAVFMNLTLLY